MEVKGTALKTTRDFIKTQFPDQYDKWLDSLTADSRKILYINAGCNCMVSFSGRIFNPCEKNY